MEIWPNSLHLLLLKMTLMSQDTLVTVCKTAVSPVVTYWGQDKMGAILQTASQIAFCSMKKSEFWIDFIINRSVGFNWQFASICPNDGLELNRQQASIWNNDGLVCWCIYSSLRPSELTLKHRETHGCVVSTVATDALVLKHQAISIHNAD